MNLNRYNLGFGFFGPLEQCEEGKFMLAEEVVDYVDQVTNFAEEQRGLITKAVLLIEDYSGLLKCVLEELSQERKKNKRLAIAVFVSMALALLNAALIIFKTSLLN